MKGKQLKSSLLKKKIQSYSLLQKMYVYISWPEVKNFLNKVVKLITANLLSVQNVHFHSRMKLSNVYKTLTKLLNFIGMKLKILQPFRSCIWTLSADENEWKAEYILSYVFWRYVEWMWAIPKLISETLYFYLFSAVYFYYTKHTFQNWMFQVFHTSYFFMSHASYFQKFFTL